MRVIIKTIEEMLEDPAVFKDETSLQKDGEVFFLDSSMEKELCGKTLRVDEEVGTARWPYIINGFFIPTFSVKEILRD